MSNRLKCLLMVLGVILSVVISISSFWLPKAKSENAPENDFSAMRAMQHVEKIAAEIHPIATPENKVVQDYIINELENLGLKVDTQKTYSSNLIWGKVRGGKIANIYTILEGSGKEKDTILMMAHYDSTYGGPGAADDASGVASLLEIIRILKIIEPLENDVMFLFTDGEEEGLLGAAAFVKYNTTVNDIDLVINLEARGNSGPSIMFETADDNGWFMQEFKKAGIQPVAYSFSYEIYKRMSNDTDFTKFKEIGKSGFNFANISGFYTYHSLEDTMGNMNTRTLQQMGENALGLIRHFGELDLKSRQSNNAVYFTAAKSVFIMYSENLAIPLAGLAFILLVAAMYIGRKRKISSIRGNLLGFIITLFFVGVSIGIGLLSKFVMGIVNVQSKQRYWFNPDYVAKLTNSGIICLMIAIAIIIVILTAGYRKLQRKISIYSLSQGTLFIWLALTLVSSIMFKSASYIFVWPTLTLLLGLVIMSILHRQIYKDIVAVIIFTLVTAVSVIIFLPFCYLLYLSMIMPNMFILPVLTVVAALPLMLIVQMGMVLLETGKSLPDVPNEKSYDRVLWKCFINGKQ